MVGVLHWAGRAARWKNCGCLAATGEEKWREENMGAQTAALWGTAGTGKLQASGKPEENTRHLRHRRLNLEDV